MGNNIEENITENNNGTITSSAQERMRKLITRMIRIEAVRKGEANLNSFIIGNRLSYKIAGPETGLVPCNAGFYPETYRSGSPDNTEDQ
jgi:hypothetical protein